MKKYPRLSVCETLSTKFYFAVVAWIRFLILESSYFVIYFFVKTLSVVDQIYFLDHTHSYECFRRANYRMQKERTTEEGLVSGELRSSDAPLFVET